MRQCAKVDSLGANFPREIDARRGDANGFSAEQDKNSSASPRKDSTMSSLKKPFLLPFIAREDFESVSKLLSGNDREFSRAHPTYEAWLRSRESRNKDYSSGDLSVHNDGIREVRVDPDKLAKYLNRERCVPDAKALLDFIEEAGG